MHKGGTLLHEGSNMHEDDFAQRVTFAQGTFLNEDTFARVEKTFFLQLKLIFFIITQTPNHYPWSILFLFFNRLFVTN